MAGKQLHGFLSSSLLDLSGNQTTHGSPTSVPKTVRPEGNNQRRKFLHAVFLQVMIRFRHMLESWFYLKPVFCQMSGYRSFLIPKDMPEIDWITRIGLTVCIICSVTIRALPKLMFYLMLKLRVMHTINWIYIKLSHKVDREMKASSFDWSKIRGIPLPEYDIAKGNTEEFYQTFVKTPHPVVLKGYLKYYQLMEKYRFDKLMEEYGDEHVLLAKDGNDGIPGQLKDVMNLGTYLCNSEVLLKKHPSIQQDIKDSIRQLETMVKKTCSFSQMFIGRKGTGTSFHFANTHNVFYMIEGKKKWYLMDPHYGYLQSHIYMLGSAAQIMINPYPQNYNDHINPAFK